MWDTIELRELRVFLTLAEELHFGRTASRLGLTQSRVSQTVRALERKLNGALFHRTSRRVALTPFGRTFRAEAGVAYERLSEVLRRSAHGGTLRLGIFEPCAAGPHLTDVVEAFERAGPAGAGAAVEVQVSEIALGRDPVAVLRRGEVDLLAARAAIRQPDLVLGPVLVSDRRVLAVSADHPLAGRAEVDIEDVAEFPVTECAGIPKPIMESFVPPRTPGGRELRRIPASPVSPYELASLVARGRIVHPTVPSFASFYGQPGIVYVPIVGLPPADSALLWPRHVVDPRRDEFVRVAARVLVGAEA